MCRLSPKINSCECLGNLAPHHTMMIETRPVNRMQLYPVQEADMAGSWRSFCASMTAGVSTPAQTDTSQQQAYHARIPQLTGRLGSVMSAAVGASEALQGPCSSHRCASSP